MRETLSRSIALVLTLSLTVNPGLALAQQSDPELDKGVRLVRQGEYAQAIIVLDQVARRLAGKPAQKGLAAQAYLNLGIAYVGEGQETLAKASFRDAISRDEALQLTAFDVSPKVRDLFQKAKDELAQQKPAAAPAKKGGGGKGALIVLGVLAVAGGGVAVAAGGGGGGGGDGSGAGSALPPGINFKGSTPASTGGSTISLANPGNGISLSFDIVHNRSQIGSVLQVALKTTAGTRCFDQTMSLPPDARANQGQPVPVNFFLRVGTADALCAAPFVTSSIAASLNTGLSAEFTAGYSFVR